MTEKIIITIDGIKQTTLLDDLLEVVVDTSLTMPSMFSLLIHDDEDNKTSKMKYIDSDTFKIGSMVKISISTDELPFESGVVKEELITGEITAIEPIFSAGGPIMLKIRGYDKSHRLTRGKKSRTFLKKKDSDIMSQIAGEAGLSYSGDATTIVYDYLMQHNQTDWDFLLSRSRRIGYQLFFHNGKLNFLKIGSEVSGSKPGKLTWGLNLRKFEPRVSVVGQVSGTTVTGWDIKTKKEISGQEKSVVNVVPKIGLNVTSGGDYAKKSFGEAVDYADNILATTADMAKGVATGAKILAESTFIQAQGECAFGDPRLIAGKMIEVDGIGTRFSGKYHVTEAQHEFSAGTYTVTFGVSGLAPNTIHSLLSRKDALDSNRIDGVVTALVTNLEDPDKLGRVQVKFPWLPKDKSAELSSTWARIASIGAGNDRGIFILPEINDEVLVAFEHGDMNFPYVVGSLWNGKDKPPLNHSSATSNKEVNNRIIKSRSGHVIELNDEKGKEKIIIKDKSEKNIIEFDTKNKSITFKAEGDLIFESGGKFNITSTGDFSVKSKAKASLESQSAMSLESKQKATMKAGQSELALQMTGSSLKGTQIEINGTAKTEVKSGAMVQIQGAIVKIN
ncbi:MAG TPA: VgrG-related protein [Anaerolineaceae bacterium]|nr:VgrG-related protein [Anaerolineaceae bacterium]